MCTTQRHADTVCRILCYTLYWNLKITTHSIYIFNTVNNTIKLANVCMPLLNESLTTEKRSIYANISYLDLIRDFSVSALLCCSAVLQRNTTTYINCSAAEYIVVFELGAAVCQYSYKKQQQSTFVDNHTTTSITTTTK